MKSRGETENSLSAGGVNVVDQLVCHHAAAVMGVVGAARFAPPEAAAHLGPLAGCSPLRGRLSDVLGQVMPLAGVMRGMELDINPARIRWFAC